MMGHTEIVDKLLEWGAVINIETKDEVRLA